MLECSRKETEEASQEIKYDKIEYYGNKNRQRFN